MWSMFSLLKKSRKASAKAAIAARWQKENIHLPLALIRGSRIMNLGELSNSIVELTSHRAKCGGVCFLQGKIQHAGLAVVLTASCMQEFRIHSSTQVTTSQLPSKKPCSSSELNGSRRRPLSQQWECQDEKGKCSKLVRISLERL